MSDTQPSPITPLSNYPSWYRKLEWIGVIGFVAIFLSHVFLWFKRGFEADAVIALTLGWLAADFASGLVHWFADSWGKATWPLLGPALIRPFREHHVAPEEITRHDYVEVNGSAQLATLPVLMGAHFMPEVLATGLVSFCFFVGVTNQIHKWAHMPETPRIARLLGRIGLVLSSKHHARHHTWPFDDHYCITAGLLNSPLSRIRFFRFLEKLVTSALKAQPRTDETHYLKMAQENISKPARLQN